ncbi:MAG: 2-dehydropantoate 2-reductase [Candidatus Bathyarchaeota archaeon]|nr:2-dehydropantoate 2-reductase [Candidatus Bathyarchaeota archaeon]
MLGAGAIGSLFGGYLTKEGNDVILVGREKHVKAIQKKGLTIRDGVEYVVKVKAATSVDQVETPLDLILLTAKAYDTRQAILEVNDLMDEKTTLLCLQNGLGTEEIASELIENPLRGVTSNGSLLVKPGVIAHTGRGDTILGEQDGSVTQRMKMIADTFTKAGLNTRITENIQGVVWTKTLVNSGINPFGALTGMKNGELIREPSLKGLMIRTVEEGVSVAEKIGITLEGDPVDLTLQTAERTANNRNSMLQDILRNKRTEIDFINGAISEHGRRNQVPTPINEVLTGLIRTLEHKNKN